jgi:hypothetical protein
MAVAVIRPWLSDRVDRLRGDHDQLNQPFGDDAGADSVRAR